VVARVVAPARPADRSGCDPSRGIVGGSFNLVRVVTVRVAGTKTVEGSFRVGGAVTYTLTFSNTSSVTQADNPGDEFSDVLPSSLTIRSVDATAGTTAISGNTVTWNGSLAPGGSVVLTIQATVDAGSEGQLVSNQGAFHVDTDGDRINDAPYYTDDPAVPFGAEPTVFQVSWNAASFFTLPPCRVVDTRLPNGPRGGPQVDFYRVRVFRLTGACGIPATAKAVSLNVGVTQGSGGHLRLYPAGTPAPLASTINFGYLQTRSNNAVLPLNPSGEIAVSATGSGHVILDVNGYFE
jgi:uncharacterized repeat protein (TIGR01451 family)